MKQKHWQVSVFDKTSKAVRDDTFYTTDTEAYLVFELVDEGFEPDSATVAIYNVNGKATVNASADVADGIVRYEMPLDAIVHSGGWRTQVIFTTDSEDYTTKIIEFNVGGHLLDSNKPAIVDIENWNSFIKYAGEFIGDLENQVTDIQNKLDNGDFVGEKGEQGIQGLTGDKGDSIEYDWNGTQLGVKTENEPTFNYVDLKGEKGDAGSIDNLDITDIEDALGFMPMSADDVQEGIILGEGPIEKGWLFKPVTIVDERNE